MIAANDGGPPATGGPPFAFDCADCGRAILHFGPSRPSPALCGHCLHIPGWFNDDKLRGMLDPEMAKPRPGAALHAPQRSPAWITAQARWLRNVSRAYRKVIGR